MKKPAGIGWKIKVARAESGLTQQELGTKLNTSHSVIATWESEKFMPNQESLKKLAEALGKPISYFFDYEYDQKNNTKTLHLVKDSSTGESDVNTLRVPVLSNMSDSLPYFTNDTISGFIELPRYLFPGAKFIIQMTDPIAEQSIMQSDYCIIRPENVFINNKVMLLRIASKFYIYKIAKGKTVELVGGKAGETPPSLKEYKIVGEIIGTIRKFS